MSGWDDKCDGKLRLRTEVTGHRDGELTCPAEVEHVVRIDNVSVCDLKVTFTSTCQDEMLQYSSGPEWKEAFQLDGPSAPRKNRQERRGQMLIVSERTSSGSRELRRDLEIRSTVQFVDHEGAADGPVEPSARARLRLTLR